MGWDQGRRAVPGAMDSEHDVAERIQQYLREGRRQEALALFEEHPTVHASLPITTFKGLLQAGNDLRQGDRTLRVWEALHTTPLRPDRICFSQHIKALGLLKRPKEARAALEAMRLSVPPDAWCYAACVSALCDAGAMVEAEEVVTSMEQDGLRPDQFVFCSLIKGYGRKRNLQAVVQVRELMTDSGVTEDAYVVTSLIDAYVTAGQIPAAEDILRKAIAGGTCSHQAFGALIKGFSIENNVPKSLALIAEMQRLDVEVTASTYNSLLSSLITRGDLKAAMNILHSMEKNGAAPSVRTFTMLIKALGQKRDAAGAMKVFDSMVAKGVACDAIVYNVAISAVASTGDTARAQALSWDMLSSGLRPTIHTYLALGKSWMNSKGVFHEDKRAAVMGAIALFDLIKEENVAPTTELYNVVLGTCLRHGRPPDAPRVYNQMREEGLRPDIYTFVTLMSHCAKHHLLHQAFEIMEHMRQTKLAPSDLLYAALAKVLVNCRQAGSAAKLLDEMRTQGIKPQLETYLVIVEGLAAQRRPPAAYLVLKQASMHGGLRPTPRMLRAVVMGALTGSQLAERGSAQWNSLVDAAWGAFVLGKASRGEREGQAWGQGGSLPDECLAPLLGLLIADANSVRHAPGPALKDGRARIVSAEKAARDAAENAPLLAAALARSLEVLHAIRARKLGLQEQTFSDMVELSIMGRDSELLPSLSESASQKMRGAGSADPAKRFSEAVWGFAPARDVACGVEVLQAMHHAGVRPAPSTLAALVEACAESEELSELVPLLVEMRTVADPQGLQEAYSVLIRRYGAGRGAHKAADLVTRLADEALLLDQGLFSAAFQLCVASKETSLALALASSLPFPHLTAFRASSHSRQPAASPSPGEDADMQEVTLRDGSKASLPSEFALSQRGFSPEVWATLIRGFARSGNLDLSFAVWHSVRQHLAAKPAPPQGAGMQGEATEEDLLDAVLDACLEAGAPQRGVEAYRMVEKTCRGRLQLQASTYLKMNMLQVYTTHHLLGAP